MITIAQHGSWLPADTQTPISLYLTLIKDEHAFLLESSEVDGRLGRYSLLGWDFRLILSCVQGLLKVHSLDPRLDHLKNFSNQNYIQGLKSCLNHLTIAAPKNLGQLPAMTRSLCGYLGYNMSGIFEPALARILPPQKGQATLVLPGKIILFDHLGARLPEGHLHGGSRLTPARGRPESSDLVLTPRARRCIFAV